MNVREFLNAYTGLQDLIKIMEYIGDNSIGADLEEDYTEVGSYTMLGKIPDEVKTRKVEYFDIQDAVITIWLMD